MNILVTYYSRTGNTEQVARAVARALGADTEQILDTRSRAGVFGYLRSGREAWGGQAGAIQPVQKDASQYDLVIIATPVWSGSVSSPVRAYIRGQDDRFGKVAFICTQGGGGGDKAFEQMADLCGQQPQATEIFMQRNIRSDRIDDQVRTFAQRVREVGLKTGPVAVAA